MSSGDRAALGRRAARGGPQGGRGSVEAAHRPSRPAGPSRPVAPNSGSTQLLGSGCFSGGRRAAVGCGGRDVGPGLPLRWQRGPGVDPGGPGSLQPA